MKGRFTPWLLLLALLLFLPVAVGVGSVAIAPAEVAAVVWDHLWGKAAPGVAHTIVWDVRLPRALLVAAVGGVLALCGGVLQACFRNPLADPGLLGVSAGGAVGAVLAIYTGWAAQTPWALPLLAFAGAMIATFTVLGLAGVGGQATPTSLLLIGVAVGAFSVALMSLVMIKAEESEVRQILFWLTGGAEARTWEHLWMALPPMLLGVTGLLAHHRPLDALLLGEEHAMSVGVDAPRTRFVLLTLSALATGAAVSVCGAVGFVGLVVPHVLRLLTGPSARRLLPACLAGGALFLVLADTSVRLLSRSVEIPLGILTSLAGVPFFLWLLVQSKQEQW